MLIFYSIDGLIEATGNAHADALELVPRADLRHPSPVWSEEKLKHYMWERFRVPYIGSSTFPEDRSALEPSDWRPTERDVQTVVSKHCPEPCKWEPSLRIDSSLYFFPVLRSKIRHREECEQEEIRYKKELFDHSNRVSETTAELDQITRRYNQVVDSLEEGISQHYCPVNDHA